MFILLNKVIECLVLLVILVNVLGLDRFCVSVVFIRVGFVRNVVVVIVVRCFMIVFC